RTGDDGTTALGTGERRKKHDLRIAAYGTIDELNACLGLARLHTRDEAAVDAMLARIQNDLFDLGADLCTPDQANGKGPRGGLPAADGGGAGVERERGALNAERTPLPWFVPPGGAPAAALLHLPRRVCGGGERLMVELADKPDEEVSPAALKYVNRLSDFLFVASRFLNRKGADDVLWVPGQNR